LVADFGEAGGRVAGAEQYENDSGHHHGLEGLATSGATLRE
jgi:hypothetical protein